MDLVILRRRVRENQILGRKYFEKIVIGQQTGTEKQMGLTFTFLHSYNSSGRRKILKYLVWVVAFFIFVFVIG